MLFAAAVLAAALPGFAVAQDAARGRELAATAHCTNCHGADGRSQMEGIPSLAGQQPGFITLQMILFREGIRQVPAMQAFAQNMPDKDIEDLAAWFASLPPGPPDDRNARDPALFAAGQALIGPRNCASCHLPSLAGREQIPRITGQREDFLLHTMKEYRDGQRVGADTVMNSAVFGLTDADLAALAHYLSHRD
ncbi:c-type cytochrome [Falsiroseomonas bella]|uniref:c-type cytochrome n=1 Tax=Falsiroseomonas bella TaxID=2184016 RepID=UPI0018EEAD93|nr:c-type cytochrome [Falsiroseomonas bella]